MSDKIDLHKAYLDALKEREEKGPSPAALAILELARINDEKERAARDILEITGLKPNQGDGQ